MRKNRVYLVKNIKITWKPTGIRIKDLIVEHRYDGRELRMMETFELKREGLKLYYGHTKSDDRNWEVVFVGTPHTLELACNAYKLISYTVLHD